MNAPTTNNNQKQVAKRPVDRLKAICSQASVEEQIRNAMGENASLFIASLIDVYGSDNYLQKCDPGAVVKVALNAATLKLPINKGLGFAYIVPYNNVPQFQIGYKGYIQLAMRTGAYRYINADVVYEGELKSVDKLRGSIDLSGKRISDKVVGYFGYIETLNGFKKTLYGTVEDVTAHAKRYSAGFSRANGAWKTNFDEMAIKTMLRLLLSKYGVMSVEMVDAFTKDDRTPEAQFEDNANEYANGDFIDVETGEVNSGDQDVKDDSQSKEPQQLDPGF